jgi:hypothetical protein
MREFIHNDFVIGFPERWIDTSIIALAGPPDRGFSPSITITRERLEFQLNINEYAANQMADLEEELKENEYKVVEEGRIQLGDMPAYQRIHKFYVSEDIQAMQMQVYIIKGDAAITITCTTTAEQFNQSKSLFQEAVGQFRWKS